MGYLLDTNFLIGLWRQPSGGPEAAFLAAHSEIVLGMPWIVKAEFYAGAVYAGHELERVAEFLEGFPVLWPDEAALTNYARHHAQLRRTKLKVGPNDLWIAATALTRHLQLLTRNVREFSRIEGLQVVDYAREAS